MSGALLHSIAFTWKDSVTPEQVDRLGAHLGELRPELTGVQRFDFGPGLGLAPGAKDFGLVIVFDGEPDFHAYVAHPKHVQVATLARSLAADVASVQLAL